VIVATARDAARLLAPRFAQARGERLVVAHLAADLRLIRVARPRGEAGADEVTLPIAAIVRQAVRLGSAAVVLAHNHPSGDPAPSRRDVASTLRLAGVLRELGIRLFDHLIFAGTEVRSFRQLGLL
jgi:DNA repair protein RadC